MKTSNIDQTLEAFLADQAERLAERTMRTYRDVIYLLRDSMNRYGPESLSESEYERWENEFQGGDDDAFTRLFGPEKIEGEIGPFLGDFVIRHVAAGSDFLRACGTVTKRLGKWMEARGILDSDRAAGLIELGAEAGSQLPKAEKLSRLLYEESLATPLFDPNSLSDDDWVESRLWIDRVEPGELWFGGDVGPVAVPGEASRLAEEGWLVTLTLARLEGAWRIVGVGNVYP